MTWRETGMAAPMAAGRGYPVAGGEQGRMRAADADRDRVAGILSTAYSEGRLSEDEHGARLESALSARTYADLDRVVTDLPAAQATALSPAARTVMVTPVTKTNGLATASLACGLAQFAVGPVAIVLGHVARSQIKRTGEQGAGLALAGLILGWAAVILGIVLIAAVLAISSRSGHPAAAGYWLHRRVRSALPSASLGREQVISLSCSAPGIRRLPPARCSPVAVRE
jgi:hypothetical protein